MDSTQVQRKRGRPPKPRSEKQNSQLNVATAANIHTTQPRHATKILDNDITSRELVRKINRERERLDRLTVAKLNNISKPIKQDYKSKLLTEKHSLVPINSQQLTPVHDKVDQTAKIKNLFVAGVSMLVGVPLILHQRKHPSRATLEKGLKK